MYSKDQASQLRQQFWTTFGQYMGPVPSAEGLRVNWVNYKTSVKYIAFRMQADNKTASISIELSHPDTELQELFFEQFTTYNTLLHGMLGEEWDWLLHTHDDNGKVISVITKTLPNVTVYQQDNWPDLISFFKPRIVGLDEFWSDAKYAFGAV